MGWSPLWILLGGALFIAGVWNVSRQFHPDNTDDPRKSEGQIALGWFGGVALGAAFLVYGIMP